MRQSGEAGTKLGDLELGLEPNFGHNLLGQEVQNTEVTRIKDLESLSLINCICNILVSLKLFMILFYYTMCVLWKLGRN